MSPLLVFIGRGSPDTQTILVVSGKCVLTVSAVESVERLLKTYSAGFAGSRLVG